MELLRIVAMFLVLITHADFWALGAPSKEEILMTPLSSSIRIFIESISIICVNIFILISGWFSIKSSIKGLLNFSYQCLFFSVLIYIACLFCGTAQLNMHGILECLYLTDADWFVKCYIGLYILSPVLNKYCENCAKKQFVSLLIGFFVFQSVVGSLNILSSIDKGYSIVSFIGLYLLARYFRLHVDINHITRGKLLIVASFMALFNSIGYELKTLYGLPLYFGFYNYCNPIVVIESLCVVLIFAKTTLKTSRIINSIAVSAFAVFLMHFNPNINESVYKSAVQWLYDKYDGILCLTTICGWCIVVFIASILLDKVRIITYSYFNKLVNVK